MDLSIIIVSWKTKDLVRNCLASVYKETRDLDFEVILIENNSQDGTCEMARKEFPQVKLIASSENLGFAKANNLGIRQAQGRYILLLNPDTIILNGSLQKCVAYLEAHQEYQVLGCKLLYSDLTFQESCRRLPTFWDQAGILLKLHNFFPNLGAIGRYYMKDFQYDKITEVDQIMGAFMLVRGEVWENVGLLDERFFAWFEEVDWCRRAKEAGFRIVFYPDAEIIHLKGQSFNKYLKRQWLFDMSLLSYFKKHHSWVAYFGLLCLVPINLVLDRMLALLVWMGVEVKKKKNL